MAIRDYLPNVQVKTGWYYCLGQITPVLPGKCHRRYAGSCDPVRRAPNSTGGLADERVFDR